MSEWEEANRLLISYGFTPDEADAVLSKLSRLDIEKAQQDIREVLQNLSKL